MRISIIGLPGSGKSSFLQILAARGMTGSLSGKKGATIATVFIPDARLDQLSAVYQPKKQVNAAIEFIDTHGLVVAESGGFAGQSLDDARKADSLCLVLALYATDRDAAKDLTTILSEFLFSDLVVLEKTAERLRKVAPVSKKPEDQRQLEVVTQAMAALENETPLRDAGLNPVQRAALAGYQLLTLKPLLVVLNVGEDQVGAMETLVAPFRERFPKLSLTALCASLELELTRLSPAEAAEFMRDLGIREAAFERIIAACFALLDLQVFYTVGDDECRSWPIPHGSTAFDAAGAIHSDFQQGFIRAMVLPFAAFVAAPDQATFKSQATQQKRDYLMQDGDLVEFRFSVSK